MVSFVKDFNGFKNTLFNIYKLEILIESMNPINSTILNSNKIYTKCNKSTHVAVPLVISGSNTKTNQITLPTTNRNNNNNNNNNINDTNQIILSQSLLNHGNLLFNIAGNQHVAFSK